MATMNVSLPDEMKRFVDSTVEQGSYSTSSEYVRELIRRDQDRRRLRELLLDGATSAPGPRADERYFEDLRSKLPSG